MRRNPWIPSPSVHTRAHQIAIATVIISVIQGLLAQSGSYPLLFSPFRTLFRFELWRPFTALFVAVGPLEVIFGVMIIYSVGGMLEYRWGRKRMTAIALGIPLIAEVVVLIGTLLLPSVFSGHYYPGSRQVVTTLWIIFGLLAHFSGEMLNFWGTPITGRTFALIGVGFVVLSGVFGNFALILPDLITIGLCYLYMYRGRSSGLVRKLELQYYEWKLQRLKNKSGFRVIKGSKASNDDDDSDQQIH
jgi:membrane associated rhomboid family serine protease